MCGSFICENLLRVSPAEVEETLEKLTCSTRPRRQALSPPDQRPKKTEGKGKRFFNGFSKPRVKSFSVALARAGDFGASSLVA